MHEFWAALWHLGQLAGRWLLADPEGVTTEQIAKWAYPGQPRKPRRPHRSAAFEVGLHIARRQELHAVA
jgi:hypothetical protein